MQYQWITVLKECQLDIIIHLHR